jgi:hypothetical protein
LIVDEPVASVQTLAKAGGLLGVHSSLGGSLVDNGAVSPGNDNPPAGLTVMNDYT